MQKYVLLVDQEEDILAIQEAALRYFYGGEIVSSRTREEAIKALNNLGKPEIIIASLQLLKDGLHDHLKDHGAFLPLIATVDSKDEVVRPAGMGLVSSILTRPVSPEELSLLVKSFTQTVPNSPTHVPIKLKVACEVASGKFDLYLKLSGTNFVRITNKGNEFTTQEADKLVSKGISEVHLKASDSQEFLRLWEDHLSSKFVEDEDEDDSNILVMDCLEQAEKIARAFGWSAESVKASQKVIKEAVTALNTNERISALLKRKFSDKTSSYSQHVGLLCYLTSMICSELKMDESREKLVMASLMHDLSLDEQTYMTVNEWNKQAQNLQDRSPEVVRYRLHPLHASQTAQTLDILPPDVDQIILQHHEAPDGSGYPRGLGATRIHFLAAVFIMAEDLIHFLDDGTALETSLKDYLTWGGDRYQLGNFKKIFETIKPKIN